MLTSWSEVSTPAELSIASVLMRTAGQRGLDAAELGAAQVAAFAHHLAAQLAAVDAQRVVGAVADLGMALAARLDVGADAAVVEQVHRRLQDGAASARSASALLAPSMPSAARACGDSGIDFALRATDAAAGRDQAGVVVGPGRARQLEQPLALGEGRGRVRVRVEEDVAVVEGRDQPDVRATAACRCRTRRPTCRRRRPR